MMNVQIDDEVRPATADELSLITQIQAEAEAAASAQQALEQAASSAMSKLKALGLTEVEIAALNTYGLPPVAP